MDRYSRMLAQIKAPQAMSRFTHLYGNREGELARQMTRYTQLVKVHEDLFHSTGPLYILSASGRTEIAGNHTDHNNGRVLAAAITLDAVAAVSPRSDTLVRICSAGYPTVEVDLSDLSIHEDEKGTSAALVRGVAARMQALGHSIGGFDAAITSEVLGGSGLSSSAAYEVLMCAILDALYNGFIIDGVVRAQIAQYAENIYFGKPCGLMDQMASSVGGMVGIDFKNGAQLMPLDFRFHEAGYSLIVVNTGGSHDDLTQDYASIRSDMHAVAQLFGEEVLRRVRPEQLWQNLPMVRKHVGERAVLRAMHFFAENDRVKQQIHAVKMSDLGALFDSVIASGESSWRLLQNVYTPTGAQPLALALAMADQLLRGKGAWRVHGGGFAGTTLNFVPNDMVNHFVEQMENVFGAHSCFVLDVRPEGAAIVLQTA